MRKHSFRRNLLAFTKKFWLCDDSAPKFHIKIAKDIWRENPTDFKIDFSKYNWVGKILGFINYAFFGLFGTPILIILIAIFGIIFTILQFIVYIFGLLIMIGEYLIISFYKSLAKKNLQI